jgi:hypothetical protein
MVTIRAPREVAASAGKRYLSRAIAHLGQLLQRRGQAHIGVTVYEVGDAGDLHTHHLVHVARRNYAAVEAWCDGEVRHVRRTDRHAVEYITKQRQCLPPDYEKKIRRKRTAGAMIPGVRWSVTEGARQLLVSGRDPAPISSAATEKAGSTSKHNVPLQPQG